MKHLRVILPWLSLGLIGYGCWHLVGYWALVIVGGLLWLDLFIEAMRRKT